MLRIFRPASRCIVTGFSSLRNCSSQAATSTTITTKFGYEVKPERLAEIAKSPSGWVPSAETPPDLPFYVRRSRTNNLPVYCNFKGPNGSRVITKVRKVRGDLKELEKLVRARIGDDKHYQINELTQMLKVKGNFKPEIIQMLKELGF